MKPQIKAGETYKIRNGGTTGPLVPTDSVTHPLCDPKSGWSYTPSGRVAIGSAKHVCDIILPAKAEAKPTELDANGDTPKTLHDEFLMAAIQGLAGQRHGGIELKIAAAYAWADGVMEIRRERQNTAQTNEH